MLQRLLIALVRIITNTFFRRIDIVGQENVPATGPVIFAGNHPNALMDGWLLTAKCGRWPLHFLVNAKLWKYPMLGRLLNLSGAVPVYRHEEHDGKVDNESAFRKLYEVIESGNCMGVFPEGVSHAESQLTKLKTGTARIALSVAVRGKVEVTIVPCGLNYMHRHRFRSQVQLEFGSPITIDAKWQARFNEDNEAAVKALTEHLAAALRQVTLNAPDWKTLQFVQTARRLYKPGSVKLSPAQIVELNRRFLHAYLGTAADEDVVALRRDIEDYQARLDVLGIKDHQLRKPIVISQAFQRLLSRSIVMMLMLPFAIPGALLHLPVGWIAASVGERFSYEMDDIATLKVFSAILLLPMIYVALAIVVAQFFGIAWAVVAVVLLFVSFSISVWLIEAQAYLLASMISILHRTRLRAEIEDLRGIRVRLVNTLRRLVDENDSVTERMFDQTDFRPQTIDSP